MHPTGSFEPPGFAPTGKSVDLPGIEVLRFRDGLIWQYRSMYDYSLVARQLGLGLSRGGALERAAVWGQHLLVSARRRRDLG